MIQQAKLPILIPLGEIQEEVTNLTSGWHPHFNTRHYSGDWTVLSLRSPGGAMEQIVPEAREKQEYLPTPLLQLCPNIDSVLRNLGCPVMAARLMKLAPGAIIKEHRDQDLSFEKGEARIHFPVFTHPLVEFYLNKMRVPMLEGECWYINANLPHKVSNLSPVHRIHLVVDCVVNNWLEDIFAKGEVMEAPESQKEEEIKRIIEELRRQNTETSNKLAKELESGL